MFLVQYGGFVFRARCVQCKYNTLTIYWRKNIKYLFIPLSSTSPIPIDQTNLKYIYCDVALCYVSNTGLIQVELFAMTSFFLLWCI